MASLAAGLKAPCWNSTTMIGLAITASATAAGRAKSSEYSTPRLKLAMASASAPARSLRDRSGSRTMPKAMPIRPSGSW